MAVTQSPKADADTRRFWGGGLVHYMGGCNDCDATWSTCNVIGLAAQHAKCYGHHTWAETGHSYHFEGSKPDGG